MNRLTHCTSNLRILGPLATLLFVGACSSPDADPRTAVEPRDVRASTVASDAQATATPSADDVSRTADPRTADIARIYAEALREQRAHRLLGELIAEAPKRLSGSEGAARAVQWAERAFRAAGLDDVRLEPVRVPRWERGEVETLSILGANGAQLAVRALGGSVATPVGGLEAGVVRVTSFEELETRSADARGKFVLFDRPMDPTLAEPFAAYGGAVNQRSRGAIEAARHGAVGALVRSMTLATDDHPHTGAMRYVKEFEHVPAVALSTLAADALAARIAANPDVRVRLELACRTLPDEDSWNVVGDLRGTEIPEEIVLVGGHLDAWDVGVGAHDDGAGCVQALEAVRILRDLNLRPRRTLRVVFFMNEENGLKGGLAYRDAHLAELDRHVLALESDRGAFTPRGFATDAEPELFAQMTEYARLLEPYGASMLRVGDGGADIGPLREHGVPLAEFVPDSARYFDVHHADTDVLAAVHPRELALCTAAIASFVWCVANAR